MSKSELPIVCRYKPYYRELSADTDYLWCSCGLSQQQPFCDGSHKGTGYTPVRYRASQDGEEALFCACKHSADQPFCDGAHNNLRADYDEDDPDSPANRAIPVIATGSDGRAVLDGGCYVAKLEQQPMQQSGTVRYASIIDASRGAQFQSLFYMEVSAGTSPYINFGDRDCVILISAGAGEIEIGGQVVAIAAEMGVYLRPAESFRVLNGGENIHLYLAVCPLAQLPEFSDEPKGGFDTGFPTRTVTVDPDQRQSMADRFFQILVDKRIGSSVVTQFIGDVPLSKAAMHRHLYEESIVVLKGHGCLWTENGKTPVAPSDVIFLPRKQAHSLQCTDTGGMLLAGVIYPGDNPAINY